MKNTSISLGNCCDQFASCHVFAGRFRNVNKVTRAALRFLENEENKTIILKKAIQQGLNSPRVENFNFDEHLAKLKSEYNG